MYDGNERPRYRSWLSVLGNGSNSELDCRLDARTRIAARASDCEWRESSVESEWRDFGLRDTMFVPTLKFAWASGVSGRCSGRSHGGHAEIRKDGHIACQLVGA